MDRDEPSAQNGNTHSISNRASNASNPIDIQFDEILDFQWDAEFEKTLSSLARTGLPPRSSPPWPMILKALLYSLKVVVKNYFKMGPSSLFDTREEPAGGWLWTSEDLQRSINRVYLALKEFSGHHHHRHHSQNEDISHPIENHDRIHSIQFAPFTIQRLTELMFPQPTLSGIHPHYTTLPKYLRAIQRVLSVSSSVSSYAVDTFTLTHPNEYIASLPASSTQQAMVNGEALSATGIPSSPRPRRHSTSTPITPILSPIPWLVNSEKHPSLSPELTSSDGRRSRHPSPLLLSAGPDERPITPPLMSTSPPSLSASTPPQTLPSRSSPKPTQIGPASLALDLPDHKATTDSTGNQADHLSHNPPGPQPTDDTAMSNGLGSIPDPPAQSDDTVMDETS